MQRRLVNPWLSSSLEKLGELARAARRLALEDVAIRKKLDASLKELGMFLEEASTFHLTLGREALLQLMQPVKQAESLAWQLKTDYIDIQLLSPDLERQNNEKMRKLIQQLVDLRDRSLKMVQEPDFHRGG